jgi:predicted NUDIX family phosphoesterase|tara:strand:+ start:3682 stop:4326 length:645 start_codon:yes stop_codon:yes gene_type:complete
LKLGDKKYDQVILAIDKEDLFWGDHFEGFKPHEETDYESRILQSYGFMRRGPLETDPSFKQPIGYALIVNPQLKKVFAYQRAIKDEQYTETRLQGLWSWGIGGHIERSEGKEDNPIYAGLRRELDEEVEIEGDITSIRPLGYINLEHDVHAVHFGILYLVETNATEVKPKDAEVERGGLVSMDELEVICNNSHFKVEEWSETALGPLKEYLDNQ